MRNLDWAKLANYLSFGVIGLGFLAMYLGWNGAANKACVDCQIPYLISGAAVGLGLIAVGLGVLIVQNGKRNQAELERRLDALADAFENGGGPKPAVRGGARQGRGEVLAASETFHRPDCRIGQSQDAEFTSRRQAIALGLEPCRVCNP